MQLDCRRLISRPPLAGGLLAMLAALLLAGCGWHLQGAAHLPASMVAIRIDTHDRYSDFYRELRDCLLAAGAQLNAPESATSAVVYVKLDEPGQRLSSVSTSNRPEQYEVYYRIVYSVAIGGVEKIPDQPMELTATYSYDTTAVLAKQREQLSIQQALARDLAEQVLRRLTAPNTQAPSVQPVAQAAGN